MRRRSAPLAIIALLGMRASAATVEGAVFDAESQNALARTKVTLAPLPGNSAPSRSMLANDRGAYAFPDVPPGWYLLRATRTGYELAEYGQQRAGQPGVPFEVRDAPGTAEARQMVMWHQAAIAGSVVDDNGIGIPDWPVSIYSARQPIRRVAETRTDDRGNFRAGELEKGAYLVRSGGGGLEDASTVLPSYYRFGVAVAAAEPVRVRLTETQSGVVIHAVEGQLFELTGNVTGPENRPLRLTLITDTGRRLIANAPGSFTAEGVPPGRVALLVEGVGCAGYRESLVDRNQFLPVQCAPLAPPVVSGVGNETLIARRNDLDGAGPEVFVSPTEPLPPGPWELTVRPALSHYVTAIRESSDASPPALPREGWFAASVGNSPHFEITWSDKPARISGAIHSNGESVAGVPVWLELLNPGAPETALQQWAARADEQGAYAFAGLPPGAYRIASGYEVDFEEPEIRNRAVTLSLEEGAALTQPLVLMPR